MKSFINNVRQSNNQTPALIAFGVLMTVVVTALILTGAIDPMA